MSKGEIIYESRLEKLWKDPVWSKVISAGIIFICTLIYSGVKSLSNKITFVEALENALNFKLEIYKFLILIICISIFLYIYNLIRKIIKRKNGEFNPEQKIGNFTFRELYNSLLTHKIETPPNLAGSPETVDGIDLLTLFMLYQSILNLGVEWEHDFFAYHKLGPILLSYGLTEKVPTTNKADSLGLEMIQTSKIGHEFWALLEKWRVYNNEIMNDKSESLKIEKSKNYKPTP